jgi:hypothetical protein
MKKKRTNHKKEKRVALIECLVKLPESARIELVRRLRIN